MKFIDGTVLIPAAANMNVREAWIFMVIYKQMKKPCKWTPNGELRKNYRVKCDELPKQVCFLLLRTRMLRHTPQHLSPEPAFQRMYVSRNFWNNKKIPLLQTRVVKSKQREETLQLCTRKSKDPNSLPSWKYAKRIIIQQVSTCWSI